MMYLIRDFVSYERRNIMSTFNYISFIVVMGHTDTTKTDSR